MKNTPGCGEVLCLTELPFSTPSFFPQANPSSRDRQPSPFSPLFFNGQGRSYADTK